MPGREEYLALCGVPVRYIDFDADQVYGGWHNLRDGFSFLSNWTGKDPRIVTLWGPTGAGKSTITAQLLWQAINADGGHRRPRPMWVHASNLLEDFGQGPTPTAAMRAGVLAVDGIGEDMTGDWTYAKVGRVIRDRWENGKTTAVNTNLRPADLLELCNPLADVLRDGPIVEITGPSQRGRI